MLFLVIPLALLVGLLLGLLGGGGSILAVPIFVYVLGFEAKAAIAQSLLVVGVTSLVGSWGHWRAGHVQVRVAVTFGVVAMVGAVLGARLSVYMSGTTQLVLFAVVMLMASVFMLRGRRTHAATAEDVARGIAPDGGPVVVKPLFIVLQALAVGIVTGVVGVGGGFMIVPALTLLAGLPMHQAVGTSLVVIAFNGLAGFAGYLGQVQVDWPIVMSFTGIAIVGTLAGTALARHVRAASLRRGFAVFLVVVAAFILYQNREVFGFAPATPPAVQASATGSPD